MQSAHVRGSSLLVVAVFSAMLMACANTAFKGSAGKIHPTVTKEFTQDSYPSATTVRQQGFSGDAQDEKFEQGEWGKLDVLVVIDNSGSMKDEQDNLSTKLGSLLSQVDKADWQIGVVTTDPAEYRGLFPTRRLELIKKGDGNAVGKFANVITDAGIKGSGVERHFLQAVNALQGRYSGGDWVRDGSTVVVLIITDEDNCHGTGGYECAGAADLDAAFLTNYLSSIRTLGKDAKAYGIYWDPTIAQASCSTALKQANKISEVIAATGGKAGSICDGDYAPTLANISQDIARIVKYEFDLGNKPDDGTLKITVDGQDWTDFTLTDRQVKFTKVPPFGSKVDVAYKHGADGTLTSEFKLDKKPALDSIEVTIDGQVQAPGSYSWNDAEQRIEFTDKPGERAEISFNYKAVVPLKDTFSIGKDALPETIDAWVDGQRVTGITYDQAAGNVVFDAAPAAEANIKISFKRPQS